MKKIKKKNDNMLIIITALCMIIVVISIAYALLSTTLNATFGHVATNELDWNVGFETGEVIGVVKATTNTTCGEATVTTNTVTTNNIKLNALNDKCSYKLRVKNTGGVPAKLTDILPKNPSGSSCDTTNTGIMVCGNISYKLSNDINGTSILNTGNVLKPINGIMDLYLVAEYTGTNVGVAENQDSGGFVLTFSQE